MTTVLPKADPNVKIPPAVLAAAQRSEALFNQVNGVVDPAAAPAEPTAPAEPSAEPAPVPEIAASLAPAAAPVPAGDVNWEHRYNSMKGRYDRSEQTVRDLTTTIGSLRADMQSLKDQLATQVAEPPREMRAESLLTPAEVSEYGEEFLNVVGKKAREIASAEVGGLKDHIKSLESQLNGVGKTTLEQARSNLHATLDSKCPSWKEINVDDQFHAWLALPDAYSGAIRHDLLKAAYERNDSPRVLAFFQGFLSEEAAVAPAAVEPASVEQPNKVPLETLAAPGRAKTAAATPPAPAEKPTFTRAQIAEFYAHKAAGKYRGRDADAQRIEDAIFDAQRNGRIR